MDRLQNQMGKSSPAEDPALRRRFVWLGVTLIAMTLIAAALLRSVRVPRESDGFQTLIAALPVTARPIEGRLTGGFPWAHRPIPKRSNQNAPDLEQMKLAGAAGMVLEQADRETSPVNFHAAAIARLLMDDSLEAVRLLESLVETQEDPRIWSDLAAAHHDIAVTYDWPEHLHDALMCADAALALSPSMPEALFNRALIIEAMGISHAARIAWQMYIEADPGSKWSEEANARLTELEPPEAFKPALEREYPRLASGDRDAARDLVANFPQESRLWGEAEILGRWAAAHESSNLKEATEHLTVARVLGDSLKAASGEHLLSEAVRAIDAADASRRNTLARAHRIYRVGRIAYSREKPAEGEPLLRKASEAFAEGGSPMAHVARYYAANTVFDQYRIDEAMDMLESVNRVIDARFVALQAQVEWQLALAHIAKAAWGKAFELLDNSHAQFVRLGEREHAAFVRTVSAGAYEAIGETARAAAERSRAARTLCLTSTNRCQTTTAEMTRNAMKSDNWRAAESLVALELDSVDSVANAQLHIDALFRQARIRLKLENLEAARESWQSAGKVGSQLHDAGLRKRYEADSQYVQGLIFAAEGSHRAAPLLTSAMEFHLGEGRRWYVPQILLARARAHRAAGNEIEAWTDLRTAIEELESQRATAPEGEIRSGLLDTAEELFREAVGWHLDRRDPASAFHYAERGRARVLFDSLGESPEVPTTAAIVGVIPDGTSIVEFFLMEDRLVTFVADRRGVSTLLQPLDREDLQRQTEQFRGSVSLGEGFKESGATLYDLLIRPIEKRVHGAKELVLVGEASLQSLPAAALVDRTTGSFLVEKYRLVTSPSAAVYSTNIRRAASRSKDSHLVAVGNPAGTNRRLESAEEEASLISARYRSSSLLLTNSATREAFLRAAPDADVIHFAGHGIGIPEKRIAALRLAAADGEDGILYASEIARLSLPRTRLVVLAGCDTARGEIRRMEGTQSTARAFLAAGVPTVIATLWQIDDEASRNFFVRLHENLLGGLKPSAALQAAQLEYLKRGVTPAVWAATQSIGN